MKKPLSYFRHMNRHDVAQLDGMKSIMRVETPRKREYWLVLPAVGDSDSVCVLIKKYTIAKFFSKPWTDEEVLAEYASRIVA